MVIIWLMMVNNILVGGFKPTPLKNHGVSEFVSWDDDSNPNFGLKNDIHVPNHQSDIHIFQPHSCI